MLAGLFRLASILRGPIPIVNISLAFQTEGRASFWRFFVKFLAFA
jgi:hypothetical protein